MANTFSWNTSNGDWSIGTNWTDLTSGTAGPPTAADDAEFFTTGGTITGTGTAFDVFFSGINPWTLAGNFAIADEVLVGNNAPATVIIASGGTIAVGGTFNAVGNNAGSDGSLQITSGGTLNPRWHHNQPPLCCRSAIVAHLAPWRPPPGSSPSPARRRCSTSTGTRSHLGWMAAMAA